MTDELKRKLEEFRIKLNTWNNIDFESLKTTNLEWNNDKTVGYKLAIMDLDTNLKKILEECVE